LNLDVILASAQLMGASKAIIAGLISAFAQGIESYPHSQWVLRHVLVIAANSSIRPSLVNVGRMYTTDMLRAVESIPDTLKFDLPSGWWLKRTATVEQTAADKFTIAQEYWHADSFDSFVYDMAV